VIAEPEVVVSAVAVV
jgi:hypothetical protein